MLLLRLTVLALAFIVAVPTESAAWRFSNPKPHGNNILDMATNNDVVWQIGDRGQVYTSEDLDTWLAHQAGTTKSLRSITFFKGKAFISAEEGAILTAPSPDSFTLTDLQTTDWLEGIAASADVVVAVGDNGAIFSSADGVRWARRGNFSTWLRSVAFGLGQFVVVGEDGFLATSGDGQKWDRKSLNMTSHLNKVAFVYDRFWIVGDGGKVLTNNAGMNFKAVDVAVTNTLFAVTGNSNEVVVAGDSTVLLGNLRTGAWTPQADASSPNLAPVWPYYSALWDGRLFLIGGRTGLKVEGFRTNDVAPIVWYSDPQPTRNWLWSAVRATDFYVACGVDGTIVTSLDGVNWTREVVPAAATNRVLLGVTGNTNALIAVGSGGIALRSPNIITNTVSTNSNGQMITNQISLLGVIWEQPDSPTSSDLQAVAATSEMFVMGGSKGSLFSSADGKSWQRRISGVTNFLSSATPWSQGWIASGAAGVILSSTDGIVWTRRDSGTTNWVYSVRYVGGHLVAVGENGLILTSENGAAWTKRSSGTTEWLNDVTFVTNTWFVAGGSGIFLTSANLANWTVTRSITSKSLYAAVTDGQQLIMTGLEGVILRNQVVPLASSVDFAAIDRSTNATFFLFSGGVDQRFQLEQKTALNDPWAPAATLELPSDGTLIYEHPNDAAARSKFFRTRLLGP